MDPSRSLPPQPEDVALPMAAREPGANRVDSVAVDGGSGCRASSDPLKTECMRLQFDPILENAQTAIVLGVSGRAIRNERATARARLGRALNSAFGDAMNIGRVCGGDGP